MWEVMGAATKSSSRESRSTTAGRNLPPGVWWKSILIRTISPRRRVMDQRFVDRVVGVVRCFELPPPGRAPRCIVLRDAPLEYDLNLFPWGHLGCDLGRNCNLAVRREFTSEISGFHLKVPYCLYHLTCRNEGCACQSDGRASLE